MEIEEKIIDGHKVRQFLTILSSGLPVTDTWEHLKSLKLSRAEALRYNRVSV